jgi:hypothetical protein
MFDSRPARVLKHELLAITPGTSQFAQRLRAIAVSLEAEQTRLAWDIEPRSRLSPKRDEDALEPRPPATRRLSE